MSEVIERLKVKFVGEASISLDRIAEWINELHHDGSRAELVGRIREEAHGLKGAAAVLEFEEFRDRTADLENAAALLSETEAWAINAVVGLEKYLAAARVAAPKNSSIR